VNAIPKICVKSQKVAHMPTKRYGSTARRAQPASRPMVWEAPGLTQALFWQPDTTPEPDEAAKIGICAAVTPKN
jgi:hypothetical protein